MRHPVHPLKLARVHAAVVSHALEPIFHRAVVFVPQCFTYPGGDLRVMDEFPGVHDGLLVRDVVDFVADNAGQGVQGQPLRSGVVLDAGDLAARGSIGGVKHALEQAGRPLFPGLAFSAHAVHVIADRPVPAGVRPVRRVERQFGDGLGLDFSKVTLDGFLFLEN